MQSALLSGQILHLEISRSPSPTHGSCQTNYKYADPLDLLYRMTDAMGLAPALIHMNNILFSSYRYESLIDLISVFWPLEGEG